MAAWFRQSLSPHHTALAMIGAKAGDRVAILGATDPGLAAEVARVTGLNGQTTVFDTRAGGAQAIEAAAAEAGTLVEYADAPLTQLPIATAERDLAIVLASLAAMSEMDRAAAIRDAMRVLRPGGRLVVIDGTRRGAGLLSVLQPKSPRLPSDQVLALLDRAGARAHRQLADTDGVGYYEARKTGVPAA